MTAPAYALVQPKISQSRDELMKLLAETPGYKQGLKMAKADIIVALDLAKRAYWDKAHKAANAEPPQQRRRARSQAKAERDFCEISAEECNAWLATLPRAPHA